MKSTGIVRKVDQLGRIGTPHRWRSALGVSGGDPTEFFLKKIRFFLGNMRQIALVPLPEKS